MMGLKTYSTICHSHAFKHLPALMLNLYRYKSVTVCVGVVGGSCMGELVEVLSVNW